MYSLSIHIFGKGERVPLLRDARGLPLFYPTLFATSQLRNAGRAVNTIVNQLRDILVLLRWQVAQDPVRDLEAEFAKGKFLSVGDVDAIRDFASLHMQHVDRAGSERLLDGHSSMLEARVATTTPSPTVEGQQHYNRLSTIAAYLEFIASAITQHMNSQTSATQISRMAKLIRKHRPRGLALRREQDPHEKSPPTELVERFMATIAVDSPQNPFRSSSVRLRNAIMFGLFEYTGIRLGEMLSVRVDQIDFGEEPQVWVRRNQDDPSDDRRRQPSSKTKERPVPIPEGLANLIYDYVMKHRAALPAARRHPYLFVSHRGETAGRPLSISALNKIMEVMRAVDATFVDIHPHAFRHHFNYDLSVAIDAHNARVRQEVNTRDAAPITEGRELDIRAFLNGHWSKTSSAVYNSRHIREVSDKAIRELQSGLGRLMRGKRVEA